MAGILPVMCAGLSTVHVSAPTLNGAASVVLCQLQVEIEIQSTYRWLIKQGVLRDTQDSVINGNWYHCSKVITVIVSSYQTLF